MLIHKEHAQALLELFAKREEGTPYMETGALSKPVIYELEVQGLTRMYSPIRVGLTYLGGELALLLRELIDQGTIKSPETWPDGWRWLGSEVIAMLDAAQRAGQVGPLAIPHLTERGLATEVHEKESGKQYVGLTDAGQRILEIYAALRPKLEVSAELAEIIRKTPMGPASSAHLSTGRHEEHLLEGMRLIAYSVPTSDVYAFTALGQAVKKALEYGGFATEGDVLTEDLLWALADVVDGRETNPVAKSTLQALGYLDANGELLLAGEWALEAFRLWHDGARTGVWTIALTEEEARILATIDVLWQKAQTNPEEQPTFANLRAEMIDRKIKAYKALVERYGRKLEEMPKKYRLIAQRFMEAKDLARWFDDNFDLRASLYSLESFRLIETVESEDGREVFVLTDHGQAVLGDQKDSPRDISSTAVKSITMTRKTFSAPNYEWWQEAQEAKLVGSVEPTASGYLYARLAETIYRLPHLTKFELKVFHVLPAQGMSIDEVFKVLSDEETDKVRWALEKLEARHLIDILPDGNIVETDAGRTLDEALAGVPEGFGHPVNPILYRVIKAVADVGTLYTKEERVRVLPRNMKEALKRSGLPKEVFDNALEAARAGGFMGRNSVNKAGLLLLEAVEKMNPRESLAGFTGPSSSNTASS